MAVDIREKVEKERGLLKKIELAIPGFRGYRRREDLRIADSLLRKQLADKLKNIGLQMESCRDALRMHIDLLEDVGRLINNIQSTENRVRHAEQGYTGISADYRIDVDDLNRLYEFDLALIDDIEHIGVVVTELQNILSENNIHAIRTHLQTIKNSIQEFTNIFNKRIETIAGLLVVGR